MCVVCASGLRHGGVGDLSSAPSERRAASRTLPVPGRPPGPLGGVFIYRRATLEPRGGQCGAGINTAPLFAAVASRHYTPHSAITTAQKCGTKPAAV